MLTRRHMVLTSNADSFDFDLAAKSFYAAKKEPYRKDGIRPRWSDSVAFFYPGSATALIEFVKDEKSPSLSAVFSQFCKHVDNQEVAPETFYDVFFKRLQPYSADEASKFTKRVVDRNARVSNDRKAVLLPVKDATVSDADMKFSRIFTWEDVRGFPDHLYEAAWHYVIYVVLNIPTLRKKMLDSAKTFVRSKYPDLVRDKSRQSDVEDLLECSVMYFINELAAFLAMMTKDKDVVLSFSYVGMKTPEIVLSFLRIYNLFITDEDRRVDWLKFDLDHGFMSKGVTKAKEETGSTTQKIPSFREFFARYKQHKRGDSTLVEIIKKDESYRRFPSSIAHSIQESLFDSEGLLISLGGKRTPEAKTERSQSPISSEAGTASSLGSTPPDSIVLADSVASEQVISAGKGPLVSSVRLYRNGELFCNCIGQKQGKWNVMKLGNRDPAEDTMMQPIWQHIQASLRFEAMRSETNASISYEDNGSGLVVQVQTYLRYGVSLQNGSGEELMVVEFDDDVEESDAFITTDLPDGIPNLNEGMLETIKAELCEKIRKVVEALHRAKAVEALKQQSVITASGRDKGRQRSRSLVMPRSASEGSVSSNHVLSNSM